MDMLGSTLKATHAKAKGSLKEKGKRAKRKVKKTARNSLLVMMNEKLMESSYNKKPKAEKVKAPPKPPPPPWAETAKHPIQLQSAAFRGSMGDLQKLIDEECRPVAGQRDQWGRTALHWAAIGRAEEDILRRLLNAGCDPNAQDNDGETALHKAAWNGDRLMVKFLVEVGADTNVCDHEGWCPAHFAVMRGHTEIVAFFMDIKEFIVCRRPTKIPPLGWKASADMWSGV